MEASFRNRVGGKKNALISQHVVVHQEPFSLGSFCDFSDKVVSVSQKQEERGAVQRAGQACRQRGLNV